MKTKILCLALLLFCSLGIFAVDLKWRQINYDAQQDLRSVFAIGNDTAFIAGASGAILRTTNDAKSWTRTDITGTPQLNSIRFAPQQIGFAVGNGGVILKTSDGGDHWIAQNSGTSLSINALAIPKLSNIWAAGDSGLVIHSVDSGRTWSRIDTIVKNKESIFIAAYTSKKIELYSRELDKGKCYISENGGKNWRIKLYEYFFTDGISYMNDSIGYSVSVDYITGGGGGVFSLFYTSNAGKDWFEMRNYSPSGGAYGDVKTDIHISNDTTGYIVNKNLIAKVLRISDKLSSLTNVLVDRKVVVTNLSHDVIKIKSSDSSLSSVQIYNIAGVLLSEKIASDSENELFINLSSMPPGVYIIRIRMSEGSVVQTKLVKR